MGQRNTKNPKLTIGPGQTNPQEIHKVHKLHTLNKPSGNAEAVRDRVHKSQPQDKPSGNSAMYKQLERLEYLAVIEL